MHKRWRPFNPLTNSAEFIGELNKKRNKYIEPTFSEEQILKLNNTLIYSYKNKIIVTIYYYHDEVKTIKGLIKNLDPYLEIIKIEDIKIPFKKIIKVCKEKDCF